MANFISSVAPPYETMIVHFFCTSWVPFVHLLLARSFFFIANGDVYAMRVYGDVYVMRVYGDV